MNIELHESAERREGEVRLSTKRDKELEIVGMKIAASINVEKWKIKTCEGKITTNTHDTALGPGLHIL